MAKAKKTRTTAIGKRNGRNRDRGKEYEREIAAWLRLLGFPNAARSFGQSATGAEAPDVVGTPFWVECGKGRTVRPAEKLKQAHAARAACPDPKWKNAPVVVFTYGMKGAPHLVTMDRDTFLRLIEELQQLREEAEGVVEVLK